MGEISKEELNAFTMSHEKTATVLEKIAGQLEQITSKQDKMISKLENGLSTTIIEGVTKNYNQTHRETIESLNRAEKAIEFNKELLTDKIPTVVKDTISNSSIAKDVEHTKWLVSSVGIVVVIVSIILKMMGTSTTNSESKILQHMLQQHITQTEGSNARSLP
jgi:archaellum component FlaC